MTFVRVLIAALAALLGGIAPALAQDSFKVGMLVSLTGPFAPVGKQMLAGAKLYMQQNGETVAGKKIELLIKDDGGVPDNTRRLAQELVEIGRASCRERV